MAMSYARFPIFFLVIAGLLCIWPATGRSEDKQAGSVYEKVLERGSIRCGYLVWPPYITKDPNTLQLGGINYLIMEEIGKTLGLKIEWVEEVGAGEAIQGLNTGRYDVMCATLWPDQARLKSSLMTRPTFYSTVYAVVRADDNRFDGKRENMNAPDVTFTGIEGDVTKSLAMESFPKAKNARHAGKRRRKPAAAKYRIQKGRHRAYRSRHAEDLHQSQRFSA
ncbi:MAG: transporter substrate-binding domain-containing protein [Alphaproteobacteria bacterium]